MSLWTQSFYLQRQHLQPILRRAKTFLIRSPLIVLLYMMQFILLFQTMQVQKGTKGERRPHDMGTLPSLTTTSSSRCTHTDINMYVAAAG